ncbi:GGDEF domain-containing protein [Stutzerimonas xanthomarina]|uniref:GGDEF domain-containing protein n=1 Tax=Stutzerimonas xanthomarina TaxID=271420 RepID=UPI003AA89D3B
MLADKQPPSTIDISTARLRRLEISCSKTLSTGQHGFSERLRHLTLRLQTSLELDRLLEFFFEEVSNLTPLQALSYCHSGTDFQLQIGEANGFDVSYSLSHSGDCLGELRLFSSNYVPDSVLEQLENALDCLLFPLRNALLYRQAVQASLKDSLTGAGNRTAMVQALSRETELSRRHCQPMSIIMLDMDHFKRLNDIYGHQAGDAALKATALLLREQLRNVDMVFRFGGEEFVLVLSNSGPQAAAVVAERIRAAVQNLCFLVGDQQVRLSTSLGCATYQPCESQDDLLHRADQALYQAKKEGRNRTRMASL